MLEAILIGLLLAIMVVSSIVLVLMTIGIGVLIWIKVPYAPVPQQRVKRIIDLFELKPGQKFYDLGCGDGRFVIEAAKQDAQAIGYEISPWVCLRAKFKIWLTSNKGQIVFKNFYHIQLTEADAVFCFLVDKVMQKVENKLMAELKPGAKVICYGFKLPNWQPEKIVYLNPDNKKIGRAFLYIKK